MESNEVKVTETGARDVIRTEIGYDKQEPKAGLIAGLTVATFVALIAVILGVQSYYDRVRAEQVYVEQLVPVSQDLKDLRNAEDEVLNSYKVVDNQQGIVRIPVKRAMELVAKEAAEGKLQYAQKTYPVKVPGAPAAGTPIAGVGSVVKQNGSTNSAPAAKP